MTNDVQPLAEDKAEPRYTLLLNAQGRLLHDFFLFRAPGAHHCSRCTSALPALPSCLPRQGLRGATCAGANPKSSPVLLADIHQGQQQDLIQLLKRRACALDAVQLTVTSRRLHPAAGCLQGAMRALPLLVARSSRRSALTAGTRRYRLRRQVEVDDVSDEYVPWVKFGLDQLLDSAPCCAFLDKRMQLMMADKNQISVPCSHWPPAHLTCLPCTAARMRAAHALAVLPLAAA